jgi:hypothetical protein
MQRKKVLQHWVQRVSGLGEGFLLMPLVTHATTIPPPLPAFSLSCSIFKDFFCNAERRERERERGPRCTSATSGMQLFEWCMCKKNATGSDCACILSPAFLLHPFQIKKEDEAGESSRLRRQQRSKRKSEIHPFSLTLSLSPECSYLKFPLSPSFTPSCLYLKIPSLSLSLFLSL